LNKKRLQLDGDDIHSTLIQKAFMGKYGSEEKRLGVNENTIAFV
jgi:chemotaxis methyl-accepting protein methylase